jgi:ubiquinone/menaquinone biosynthesis C-methylase UbiE
MDQRQAIASVFDRAAATYDQVGVDFFQPIASALVAELAPGEGERILDIGCGRGAALVPFGLAVGTTGSVTGIDLSPNMAAAARQAAADAGIPAKIVVGDAQVPDLPPASYDVIGSSLVLFFLPDPLAALTAWRELLVTGGRLGVSTFGDCNHQWRAVDAVLTPFLPQGMRDARTSGAAGPFSSDAGVEQLLREAGYTDIRTATTVVSVRFTDHDHWYRWSWSVGQRGMWEAIPEEHRPEVKALAYEQLEACRDSTGRIGFEQNVRYTLGSR